MSKYDPRELGAKCDVCPLGPNGCLRPSSEEWVPVKPDLHEGAAIAAVVPGPRISDVARRQLYSDAAGGEWGRALNANGLIRRQVALIPVTSCRPPGKASGAWKKMEADLKRKRKEYVKELRDDFGHSTADATEIADHTFPHPADCCRPRLVRELLPYRYIYAMGATPAQRLLKTSSKMGDLEGDMVERKASEVYDEAFLDGWDEWPVKILPTFDPALVSHRVALRPQMYAALGKGLRWFNDCLNWREPEIVEQPTAQELRDWLSEPAPFWVYDLETSGIEPLQIDVWCIAIATPDMVDGRPAMPWEKPDQLARTIGINLVDPQQSGARFYRPSDEAEVLDALREFFTDETKRKTGHNAGYYDLQCVKSWLGVTPFPQEDTLFDARFSHPDIPKGLKPTGRRITDVRKWETNESGEKNSSGKVTPQERLRYCEYDTVVNARIVAPLQQTADENGASRPLPDWAKPVDWSSHRPWTLRGLDHSRQQDLCVPMHENGVYVDGAKVVVLTHKFEKLADRLYHELQDLSKIVGMTHLDMGSVEDDDDIRRDLSEAGQEFKPGSYDQIRDLLYGKWRLGKPYGMDAKEFYTETGLPGTGDAVLRAHMANPHLQTDQRRFLEVLRQFRRVKTKVLGTQLYNMRPQREGGFVHPDGRVRSTWNSHTTAVGRLSSSGPNMQNQSSRKDLGGVRTIFCAAPGNVLVGCDLDSAHLVVIANYWGVSRLIESFTTGKCPHVWLAHDLFGSDFEAAGGWGDAGFSLLKENKPDKKKRAGKMRELSKTYRYNSAYWGEAESKHRTICATEFTRILGQGDACHQCGVVFKSDAPSCSSCGATAIATDLPYLNFDLNQIRFFDKVWHENEPEWMIAWKSMMDLYEKQGWMEDPLFGRRSGVLNGGKRNEVVNFPIIACEAAIMSIAEQRVMRSFPHRKWGPGTGIVAQVHDSLIVEVPAHLAEWARDEMERCMTIQVPGWQVPFTCEADIGQTWAEV